jgi:hypothetical protein
MFQENEVMCISMYPCVGLLLRSPCVAGRIGSQHSANFDQALLPTDHWSGIRHMVCWLRSEKMAHVAQIGKLMAAPALNPEPAK